LNLHSIDFVEISDSAEPIFDFPERSEGNLYSLTTLSENTVPSSKVTRIV
jgi:hypothetical protein